MNDPMKLRAADRMAAAIDILVRRGKLDARSLPADARLDYGEPWSEEDALRVYEGDPPAWSAKHHPVHVYDIQETLQVCVEEREHLRAEVAQLREDVLRLREALRQIARYHRVSLTPIKATARKMERMAVEALHALPEEAPR